MSYLDYFILITRLMVPVCRGPQGSRPALGYRHIPVLHYLDHGNYISWCLCSEAHRVRVLLWDTVIFPSFTTWTMELILYGSLY